MKLFNTKHRFLKLAVGVIATVSLALPVVTQAVTSIQPTPVSAAKGDKGPDWSKYQGANGKFGYASDKFSISQIGGYYNGYFIDQTTYPTQVQYTIAQGKRAHTYIYARFSGRTQADWETQQKADYQAYIKEHPEDAPQPTATETALAALSYQQMQSQQTISDLQTANAQLAYQVMTTTNGGTN